MGLIYKLQNNVNGKVYIGQTKTQLKIRAQEHFSTARKSIEFEPDTLYYDIQKYGEDSFSAVVLEQCDNKDLSDRESYYIAVYDSIKSGYNKNSGGQAYTDLTAEANDKIIAMIKSGKSATEIVEVVGYYLTTIKRVAERNNLTLKRSGKKENLKLLKYSSDLKLVGTYEQISAAYRQCDSNVSESTFQHNVRKACGTGEKVCGYYWMLEKDKYTAVNGKVLEFRQPLDRRNFLDEKAYRVENGKIITDVRDNIREKCLYCGKPISNEGICLDCLTKHPRSRVVQKYIVNHRDELERLIDCGKLNITLPPKEQKPLLMDRLPDKETLRELMKSHTYKDIANMYGVYERTLREVLREYGIYEEKIARDINEKQLAIDILQIGLDKAAVKHKVQKWKATRVANDFEIETWMYDNTKPVCAVSMVDGAKTIFEQLKDAARALSSADASTSQINSLAYRIGQHMKQNTQYYDCMWYPIDKSQVIADMINKINNT